MKFINQNDYPHVKYNHNVANGGVPEERRCVERIFWWKKTEFCNGII